MHIVVLDDYQDVVRKLPCMQNLRDDDVRVFTNTVKGAGQLAIRLRDAEVAILIRDRSIVNAALVDKLPKLKLIIQTGNIGPHIDIAACTSRGITVVQGEENPYAAAELTWTLIMATSRRLPQYIFNLKHGAWQQAGFRASYMPENFGIGRSLQGKTLGVWGFGNVGKVVAGFGKAFDMRVQVWGHEKSRHEAAEMGYETPNSKEAFLATSDVLSLHLRLSEDTRHSISLSDLLHMKPTSIFVNTANAELLQPEALVAALSKGTPGMAAVDVYETEPVFPGHTLLRLENCICTPHIGYVEQNNYEHLFSQAVDSILAYKQGRLTNSVNHPATFKIDQDLSSKRAAQLF